LPRDRMSYLNNLSLGHFQSDLAILPMQIQFF
jgi:hypothetical protein